MDVHPGRLFQQTTIRTCKGDLMTLNRRLTRLEQYGQRRDETPSPCSLCFGGKLVLYPAPAVPSPETCPSCGNDTLSYPSTGEWAETVMALMVEGLVPIQDNHGAWQLVYIDDQNIGEGSTSLLSDAQQSHEVFPDSLGQNVRS